MADVAADMGSRLPLVGPGSRLLNNEPAGS
jgi:hypothetical protein